MENISIINNNNLNLEENIVHSKHVYSKWYSRLASSILDALILGTLNLAIYLVSSPFYTREETNFDFSNYFNNFSSVPSEAVNFYNYSNTDLVLYLITMVFGLAYFAYFQSKDGQTLGMKLIGIKITKEDGSNLSFGEASIRYIIYNAISMVILFLMIVPILGWIATPILLFFWFGWCLFDKKKQNLYDKIFNNIYTSKNENKTAAKFVVGCCCGAQLLFFIGLVAIFVAIVGLFVSSGSDSKPTQNPSISDNLVEELKNEINLEKNLSGDKNVSESTFTKACVDGINNTTHNFSQTQINEYCGCASRLYAESSDRNFESKLQNECSKYLLSNEL